MGEPAEPSLEDRKKRRDLACLEVQAVRDDNTSPFERELDKFEMRTLKAAATPPGSTARTLKQESFDDITAMVFGLAEEAAMLESEKRVLEAELQAMSLLIASRR